MPRDVDVFKYEIENAIEKIQKQNRTIIPRRLIEEEVENNRDNYPHLGKLENIPLKMAISAAVNRRPDAKKFGKRPTSWSFSSSPSPAGVAV